MLYTIHMLYTVKLISPMEEIICKVEREAAVVNCWATQAECAGIQCFRCGKNIIILQSGAGSKLQSVITFKAYRHIKAAYHVQSRKNQGTASDIKNLTECHRVSGYIVRKRSVLC